MDVDTTQELDDDETDDEFTEHDKQPVTVSCSHHRHTRIKTFLSLYSKSQY